MDLRENEAATRRVRAAALACFLLALAIRAAWAWGYQRPQDSVYADMAGYVERAAALVRGEGDPEVCFPPGTHLLLAAEMAVFGADGLAAIGWLHVLLGALIAPLSVDLAARCLGSTRLAAGVGLAVALWYPLITFGGYFSSEAYFCLLVVASAWAWVRRVQGERGALLAGAAAGVAYLVRPTILPALALNALWSLARRVGGRRAWLGLAAPAALAVALGAARYHDRAGRLGLISDNGAIASFFAWTDYAGLKATPPPGEPPTSKDSFHPPSRSPKYGFLPDFEFVGHRCEPGPLLAERDRVIRESSPLTLAKRALRNARALFWGNPLWPERRELREAESGLRLFLFTHWSKLELAALFPLAALGLAGLRPGQGPEPLRRARVAIALYLLAMVVAAAAYTGEVRYRVPYDPLILIFAAEGLRRLARAAGRLRARSAAQRGA